MLYYNMQDKIKADIIFYLHVIILLFGIIAPPILPKKYIKHVLVYLLLLILHWTIFGGCILTILEKHYLNETYGNTYINGFLDKVVRKFFNLKLSENSLIILSTFLVLWQTVIYLYRYTRNILITIVANVIFAGVFIKYLK